MQLTVFPTSGNGTTIGFYASGTTLGNIQKSYEHVYAASQYIDEVAVEIEGYKNVTAERYLNVYFDDATGAKVCFGSIRLATNSVYHIKSVRTDMSPYLKAKNGTLTITVQLSNLADTSTIVDTPLPD
jgi:hypothetical protein